MSAQPLQIPAVPVLTPAAAVPVISAMLAANWPMHLHGAPGIGKSDVVRQIAAGRSWPLIDLRASQLDPVDLRGLPHVETDPNTGAKRSAWAIPSFLPDAMRDGPEGILFLDEMNQAAPAVMSALYQLILDRRLGDYRLPEGWRIIAAGNRQEDRASANKMPTALANRFAHVTIVPDVAAWLDYAAGAGFSPVVVAFVRFRPNLLHVMPDTPATLAFPTPRAWEAVSKVIATDPDKAIRSHLVASIVGTAAAAEFEAFAAIMETAPSVQSIIADPAGAAVPADSSVQFAIAMALARAAKGSNVAAVLAYGARLRREFEIMLASEIAKRSPAAMETGAMVQWQLANRDILLPAARRAA